MTRNGSIGFSRSKCATCASACTPASVRPAAKTVARSPQNFVTASSTTCWIESPSPWRCHPTKGLPSYSRVSREPVTRLSGPLNRVAEEAAVAAVGRLAGTEQRDRPALVAHEFQRLQERSLRRDLFAICGGEVLPVQLAGVKAFHQRDRRREVGEPEI